MAPQAGEIEGDEWSAVLLVERREGHVGVIAGDRIAIRVEAEMGDERERLECSNELLRDFPDSEESKRMLGN